MRSLSSRLVAATVALVALVALAIGVSTTLAMRSYLTGQLDNDVHGSLERAQHGPDGGQPPDGTIDVPRGQSIGTLTAIIPAGTGQPASGWVLAAGQPGLTAPRTLSTAALAELARVPADGRVHGVELPGVGSYRVAAFDRGDVRFVSGLPYEEVSEVLGSLVWWEILLALLGIATAAVAGLVVVRRQLAPLREVAATAHEVASLPLESGDVDLSPRVKDPDERTEVGQVGAALNTLLAHVESSLSARHRSEQQVRQFVADASHELRTPLSTIRGYAELAGRTPDDATALSGSLSKVSSEADRMSGLVDDLLLLARLDAGRPLDRQPVDVTRLLLEAVTDARVLAPDHRWRLDLPEEPVEVDGDEQRLHQVITNLLTNARVHTPRGTTVTVGVHRERDGTAVVVADDGPGFPADLADTAFERFARGDVARTRTGGAGLGLSIAAAIVGAHGGRVSLSSRPGDTRITVELKD